MCERGKGEADRAPRYARRAIDLNPDRCAAYRTLARAILVLGGKMEDAITALERGKRSPQCVHDVGLLNDLAWRYLESEKSDKFSAAFDAAEEAVTRSGGRAASYDLLGRALRGQGRRTLATEAFEQGLNDTAAARDLTLTYGLLTNLCETLNECGDHERALLVCDCRPKAPAEIGRSCMERNGPRC